MVKFDFVFTNGKLTVETIDDAEGTPGSSRQYTRFNKECKPDLDRLATNYHSDDSMFTEKILSVLMDHRFEKRKVEQVKDAKGNPTNRARFFIDTVEVPGERSSV